MSEEIHNPDAPATEEEIFDVGWLEVCLAVKDVEKSVEFYQKLGFEQLAGDPDEKWAVIENDSGARLGLYQEVLADNMMNFRGGDIQKIADTLRERGITLKSDVESEPDGSLGCTVEDPDGNLIYFNTHPDELEECECGDDCDCAEGDCECDCGEGHEHHHHHEQHEEKKTGE